MIDVTLKDNISGETNELRGSTALLVLCRDNGDVILLTQGLEDHGLIVSLLNIFIRKLSSSDISLN